MEPIQRIAQARLDGIEQSYRQNMRRLLWGYVVACILVAAAGTWVILVMK